MRYEKPLKIRFTDLTAKVRISFGSYGGWREGEKYYDGLEKT